MTCGYVCPQCEGKGFTDDLEICTFCQDAENETEKQEEA